MNSGESRRHKCIEWVSTEKELKKSRHRGKQKSLGNEPQGGKKLPLEKKALVSRLAEPATREKRRKKSCQPRPGRGRKCKTVLAARG